jgi:hypothetical protein
LKLKKGGVQNNYTIFILYSCSFGRNRLISEEELKKQEKSFYIIPRGNEN